MRNKVTPSTFSSSRLTQIDDISSLCLNYDAVWVHLIIISANFKQQTPTRLFVGNGKQIMVFSFANVM